VADFSVAFGAGNDANKPPIFPAAVVFTPKLCSWHRLGGPEMAEVEVTGPVDYLWSCIHLIGKSLTVYNQHTQPIWWGMVTEIEMQMDNISLSLNLSEMANKVKAFYVTKDEGGVPDQAETAWAQNDQSVNQFGPYEETVTYDEMDAATAEQSRDSYLELKQFPLPALAIAPSDAVTVLIRGDGFYSLLSKEYYSNDNGLVEHTDGTAEQAIGVASSRSTTGIDDARRILSHVGAGFQAGNKVIISGSTSNDGTHTIDTHVPQDDFSELASATIYFEAADDIKDTGPNITVDEGDVILVNGTSNNNGIWEIERERTTNTWFEVDNTDNSIVTEAAGSASIRRRPYATLTGDPSLTYEYSGATVTATAYGQQVDQTFQTGTSDAWVMTSIAIKCKKTGAPSDDIRVRLYSDSGGAPDTLLDTATLSESDLYTEFTWTEFDFSGGVSLATGTTYHIVVDRTSTADDEEFYSVAVDEDLGYTGGSFKVYTGSAWVTREPNDADMAFRVIGRVDTTELMESIVDASSHLSGFIAEMESGLDTMMYKDGVNKASDELETLLDVGTTNDRPWVCLVDEAKKMRVWERDVANYEEDLHVSGDGRLFHNDRQLIAGDSPVGRWVWIRDLPPISFGMFTAISPAYIERAEFSIEKGEYKLEPMGVPSVFDVSDIRNR
jgi:hypothetical protein